MSIEAFLQSSELLNCFVEFVAEKVDHKKFGIIYLGSRIVGIVLDLITTILAISTSQIYVFCILIVHLMSFRLPMIFIWLLDMKVFPKVQWTFTPSVNFLLRHL